MKFSRSLILAASIASLSSLSVEAFQLTQQPRSSASIFSKTRLHSKNSDDDGRRSFLSRSAGTAMSVLLGGTVSGQPAVASYKAYARREEDWKERADKGGEPFKICLNQSYLPASISHHDADSYCSARYRNPILQRGETSRSASRDSPDERRRQIENLLPERNVLGGVSVDGEQMRR